MTDRMVFGMCVALLLLSGVWCDAVFAQDAEADDGPVTEMTVGQMIQTARRASGIPILAGTLDGSDLLLNVPRSWLSEAGPAIRQFRILVRQLGYSVILMERDGASYLEVVPTQDIANRTLPTYTDPDAIRGDDIPVRLALALKNVAPRDVQSVFMTLVRNPRAILPMDKSNSILLSGFSDEVRSLASEIIKFDEDAAPIRMELQIQAWVINNPDDSADGDSLLELVQRDDAKLLATATSVTDWDCQTGWRTFAYSGTDVGLTAVRSTLGVTPVRLEEGDLVTLVDFTEKNGDDEFRIHRAQTKFKAGVGRVLCHYNRPKGERVSLLVRVNFVVPESPEKK